MTKLAPLMKGGATGEVVKIQEKEGGGGGGGVKSEARELTSINWRTVKQKNRRTKTRKPSGNRMPSEREELEGRRREKGRGKEETNIRAR